MLGCLEGFGDLEGLGEGFLEAFWKVFGRVARRVLEGFREGFQVFPGKPESRGPALL